MTVKRQFRELLPHWVEFQGFNHTTALAAIDWCKASLFDEFDWTIHADHAETDCFVYRGVFFFFDERDAALFTLKWL